MFWTGEKKTTQQFLYYYLGFFRSWVAVIIPDPPYHPLTPVVYMGSKLFWIWGENGIFQAVEGWVEISVPCPNSRLWWAIPALGNQTQIIMGQYLPIKARGCRSFMNMPCEAARTLYGSSYYSAKTVLPSKAQANSLAMWGTVFCPYSFISL